MEKRPENSRQESKAGEKEAKCVVNNTEEAKVQSDTVSSCCLFFKAPGSSHVELTNF